MNVFLVSASIEGVSHIYSCLSCRVLVGKNLLRVYGRMASMACTADSILAIVCSCKEPAREGLCMWIFLLVAASYHSKALILHLFP